jgi:hypothetical protein
MTVSRRVLKGLLFSFALGLFASGARAATTFATPPDTNNDLSSIVVSTTGLTGACPGDVGTVTFTFTGGTNVQYNKQQISVYGEILGASDNGGGFTNTCNPSGNDADPAWWVIEEHTTAQADGVGTLAPDPGTDSCSENNGSTWPNNGGYASPAADDLTYSGQTLTLTFDVEVPAQALSNTTYYLELGVNFGNYQNQTGASEGYVQIPFTTGGSPNCATSSTVTLTKTLDSSLVVGQDSLYFIDYDFTTGTNNYVTDTIPSCLTIVDQSTNPNGGGAATVSGQTITWHVDSVTGPAVTGQLFVEVKDTCAAGTAVDNTANASTSGPTGASVATATANSTSGATNLTLKKTQYDQFFGAGGLPNGSPVTSGSVINYVLTYTFAGNQLECFDSFDSDTEGTSDTVTPPYKTGSNAPGPDEAGIGNGQWVPPSEDCSATTAADGAPWQIEDSDPDSGNYLYYGSTSSFASLLNTCPAMGVPASEAGCSTSVVGGSSFCGGEVISDVQVQTTGNTQDIGIVLRADDNPSDADFGDEYTVILSLNAYSTPNAGAPYNPPTQNNGHLFIQKTVINGANFGFTPYGCGTAGIAAPANFGTIDSSAEEATTNTDLTQGAWYTVAVMEVPSAGCDCSWGPCSDTIYASYWPIGTAQPATWMISYTDPDGFGCEGTWLPGVAAQGEDDAWDNYRVYATASISNAALWDTIPAGITYQSAAPTAQVVPGTKVGWSTACSTREPDPSPGQA